MIYLLKIAFAIILTLLITYIERKVPSLIKRKVPSLYVKASIITFIVLLGNEISGSILDRYEYEKQAPEIKVAIRDVGNGAFRVKIQNEKGFVESFNIDMPICGKIINIQELSSNIDSKCIEKSAYGYDLNTSQNNARISIENISPGADISFIIQYEPMKEREFWKEKALESFQQKAEGGQSFSITFNAYSKDGSLHYEKNAKTIEELLFLDRYTYRYIWTYKQRRISVKKYKLIATNDDSLEPPTKYQTLILLKDIGGAKRAKELYKEGVKAKYF